MMGKRMGRVAARMAMAARNRASARRSRERKKLWEAQKTAWMSGVLRENERLVRRMREPAERVQVLVGVQTSEEM